MSNVTKPNKKALLSEAMAHWVLLTSSVLSSTNTACSLHVTTSGADSNDGTRARPMLTLESAASAVAVNCPTFGGTIRIGEGNFTVLSRISILQPISIIGAGAGLTIVRAGPSLAYTWMMSTYQNIDVSSAPTWVEGFHLEGLTIEMQWVERASALALLVRYSAYPCPPAR